MKLLAFRALCVCVLAFCLPSTFAAGVQWDPDGSVHPANRLSPHFRNLSVTSNTYMSVLTVTNTITAGGLVVSAPTFSSFVNSQHNHQDAAGGGQLNASSVFSAGTIPTARLGSGVADSTTFLRGDSTWQVPAGSGSSIFFDGVSVSNPDFDSNTNVVWQINGTNVTAYVTNVTSGQILGGTGFGDVVRAGSPTISDPIFTSTIFFEGLVFTIEGAIADGNETLFEFGEPSGDATYEFDTTRMSTPGAIDVGHISDTTLERAASGFLSVEGKRVASPASAVAGDVMYFDGTEWVRLAKGLAGQVLEMNAGATAPEWDTDDSGSQTPWTSNIDGDNFSLTDVFQITSSNLISGRLFHTGTSLTVPWVMDEHEVHLSADTTFEFSSVPTNTNYVSGPRIWVVGDGASVFTNNANSILWHPTYPGVVPSGTNEVFFTFEGGLLHGYLGWKTVETNGIVIQNDNGHFGISSSAQLREVVSDESGTGELIFAGGNIGAATATTPSQGDNDTSVATTAFVTAAISSSLLTSDSTVITVSNTVTATTIYTNASFLTAGILSTNKHIEIRISGIAFNDTGGTSNITFNFFLNGSSVLTGLGSYTDANTGQYGVDLIWSIYPRDNSTGQQWHTFKIHNSTTTANGSGFGLLNSSALWGYMHDTTAVDSTAAMTVGVSATPSTGGVLAYEKRFAEMFVR